MTRSSPLTIILEEKVFLGSLEVLRCGLFSLFVKPNHINEVFCYQAVLFFEFYVVPEALRTFNVVHIGAALCIGAETSCLSLQFRVAVLFSHMIFLLYRLLPENGWTDLSSEDKKWF
jgi:hypothetical protein